ncbi:MAG: hypothetical protein GX369_08300, partial [Euryarchaeota archaeon]|nr:hypothetical protein [Euryarchaeota archaeon]
MLNDFVTLEFLGTFAGMVVALGLIVQFTKGVVKANFTDQAVRLYAFVWALVLVSLLYVQQGQFDTTGQSIWVVLVLVVINAIVVTLAAMGGYELIA